MAYTSRQSPRTTRQMGHQTLIPPLPNECTRCKMVAAWMFLTISVSSASYHIPLVHPFTGASQGNVIRGSGGGGEKWGANGMVHPGCQFLSAGLGPSLSILGRVVLRVAAQNFGCCGRRIFCSTCCSIVFLSGTLFLPAAAIDQYAARSLQFQNH